MRRAERAYTLCRRGARRSHWCRIEDTCRSVLDTQRNESSSDLSFSGEAVRGSAGDARNTPAARGIQNLAPRNSYRVVRPRLLTNVAGEVRAVERTWSAVRRASRAARPRARRRRRRRPAAPACSTTRGASPRAVGRATQSRTDRRVGMGDAFNGDHLLRPRNA